MSQLNDYIDLISTGLRVFNASRDVWQSSTDAERQTWFTNALNESFNGKHYTPANKLESLVKEVSNYNNLNQFFLENPWAQAQYQVKQTDWDIIVAREGNPALWLTLATYGGFVVAILIIVYILVRYAKKLRK